MVGQQQPESDAIGSTVRLAGAVTRARALAVADDPAVLAGAAERLPLVAMAPGQVVALELARLRGLDLDHPSGLSKVTSPR